MSIKIYVKYVKNNRDFHTTKLNLPTGNLDSKSGKIVIDALNKISSEYKKTIVMVTHDPQMASRCKRVIFLKDGLVMNDVRKSGSDEEFYKVIIGEIEKF